MKIDLLTVEPSEMHSEFEREPVLCLVEPPLFVVEPSELHEGFELEPALLEPLGLFRFLTSRTI